MHLGEVQFLELHVQRAQRGEGNLRRQMSDVTPPLRGRGLTIVLGCWSPRWCFLPVTPPRAYTAAGAHTASELALLPRTPCTTAVPKLLRRTSQSIDEQWFGSGQVPVPHQPTLHVIYIFLNCVSLSMLGLFEEDCYHDTHKTNTLIEIY